MRKGPHWNLRRAEIKLWGRVGEGGIVGLGVGFGEE